MDIKGIRPYVHQSRLEDKYSRHEYYLTTDVEQKNTVNLHGVKIYTGADIASNHRESHPNIGTVVKTSEVGDEQFSVGDVVLVDHFKFTDLHRKKEVFHVLEEGVELYRALIGEIFFKIKDDGLECREGVLLCENVIGKFVESSLHLSEELDGKRRDIAKVTQVWEGCEKYKIGDYVLLNKGGDYRFEFNKKEYIKVDTYFDDDLAIVEDEHWIFEDIRKHKKVITRNIK